MNWFKTHQSDILIAIISGAFFFALSWWLFQEKVDLFYEIHSIPVITKNQKSFKPLNNKLKIDYSGTKVDNLTITEVKFFNNGKKALRGDDVSPKIPIIFKIDKQYRILDYVIDNDKTSSESDFLIIPSQNNGLKISFKYINPDNKLTFRVLHTGFPTSRKSFNGKGLGFTQIRDYSTYKTFHDKLWKYILEGLLIITYILVGLKFSKKMRERLKKIQRLKAENLDNLKKIKIKYVGDEDSAEGKLTKCQAA